MKTTHRFPQSGCCLLDTFIDLNDSGIEAFTNLNYE